MSFIEIICIAYDENDTCQSIAEQNSNVETNNVHYSTYGQVYTSFLREVLMKLDDLQDGIPNDATERMKCYKDQKIIDLTKMHNNYESSRLQWYFETKVNGLANVLGKMELFLRCPFGGALVLTFSFLFYIVSSTRSICKIITTIMAGVNGNVFKFVTANVKICWW